MDVRPNRRHLAARSLVAGFTALCGLTYLTLSSLTAIAQAPMPSVPGIGPVMRIPDCIPSLVTQANLVGNVPVNTPVTVVFMLPMRNQAQLDALLTHLYDPNDPLYGLYLTSDQFNANYAPTQADYNVVANYAKSQGLTITAQHSNRMLLEVTGTVQTIQSAFNVHLKNYKLPSGRIFRAPDANPTVPLAVAVRLQSLFGLDNANVRTPLKRTLPVNSLAFLDPDLTGSGVYGGLSPFDIKTAYNLNGVSQTGSGQTLALYEVSGYTASDITHYEDTYGLPHVPLANKLVSGFAGTPTTIDEAREVTLDIELMAALAPNAKKIEVYEGPNGTGNLPILNNIAEDNSAQVVSISFGLAEQKTRDYIREVLAESLIFKQMAAQGQSVFAATGDSGAYGTKPTYTLNANDPAVQPYVTGVGGTQLHTNGGGGTWQSETSWGGNVPQSGAVWNLGTPPTDPSGGGGGISVLWPIPKYQSQSGVISRASNASGLMRNVPDVALNADPRTAYSYYFQGAFQLTGGTSCASPLWAAFTALVNQQRGTSHLPLLGFANPAIYSTCLNPTQYANDFHDIADGSNNLYVNYTAVPGYDLVSGWGTFNGANLLGDLALYGTPPPPPVFTQLLGNPGFENGSSNPKPWFTTAGVIDNSATEAAHGGAWKAWLGGYYVSHQDLLFQQVNIPSNITTATLSFFLHIDTAKPNPTTVHDTLAVQLRSNSNAVLTTLATFSNRDAASGYAQQTYDLSAYKGQTVQIYLVSLVDGKVATSFVVDDFALNVQ